MTTDELRRQLDRIADAAPSAAVPDDTWTRARRSVVRERVAAGGAALAVVAAVAAGVTWLPDRAEPPVAGTERGAIPSRIWTAPEGQSLTTAPDLAVGPIAAVYLGSAPSDGTRAVAISATDGNYSSLTLPGPDGEDAVQFGWDDQVVALSPDGSQLAYSFFPGSGSVGVGVVDLVTGTVRIVRLGIGARGVVRRLIWSPRGEYLLWWGQPHTSKGFGDTMAGLIAPGTTTSTPMPPEPQEGNTRGYAVGDDGTVALLDVHRTYTWRDGEIVDQQPFDVPPSWSESAQLVDGVVSELRLPFATDNPTQLEHAVLVRTGATQTWSLAEDLDNATPLGWTADGALLVEVDDSAEQTLDENVHRVELDDTGQVTSRGVSELASDLDPDRLTLATDLPVLDRPAPDWADEGWVHEHVSLLIGLGVAGGLAAMLGLRWLWRRYRAARYAS